VITSSAIHRVDVPDTLRAEFAASSAYFGKKMLKMTVFARIPKPPNAFRKSQEFRRAQL
jgi:hypothetical protein